MHRIVLLRHGESVWNRENRFTGWTDVGLTDHGREEARRAGLLLRDEGFGFDVAYTSVLKRAIKTLWIALEEMDLMWIPIHNSWRLNERHYGALQGLNKAETAAKFGDAQVLAWRRSYDEPPPRSSPATHAALREIRATASSRRGSCPRPSASRTPSSASCPTGTRPSRPP